MKKTEIIMNKPVYLGLSLVKLSEILMHEFWYDYVKPKYGTKAKLCYIAYIKTDDIYKDIAEDAETRFDTSNYELERPLPKAKNKNVIGLMKDELGGKIMTKFVGLRPKTYSCLIDDSSEDKEKGTKTCAIKEPLKFQDYQNCLEASQLVNEINYIQKNKTDIDNIKENHKEFIKSNKSILKIQQKFKNERYNVFTEEINKITLRSNEDKRMQSIELVETYAYGISRI